MKLEIEFDNKKVEPHFLVKLEFMLGDGDSYDHELVKLDNEEETIRLLKIINEFEERNDFEKLHELRCIEDLNGHEFLKYKSISLPYDNDSGYFYQLCETPEVSYIDDNKRSHKVNIIK